MNVFGWVMRALCKSVARRLACRVIGRDEDYLLRYYVCGRAPAHFPVGLKPRLTFLPTVFLHRFVRSDWDQELHNHPWDRSTSLILAGGYVEERMIPSDCGVDARGWHIEKRVLTPGSVNRIGAEDFHRVDLLESDCWTLFIVGKKVASWGFRDRHTGVFVDWRTHVAATHAVAAAHGELEKVS